MSQRPCCIRPPIPAPPPPIPPLYGHSVIGQVDQSSFGVAYQDPRIRLEENEIFKGVWFLKSCEQRAPNWDVKYCREVEAWGNRFDFKDVILVLHLSSLGSPLHCSKQFSDGGGGDGVQLLSRI